jgi:C-22 sterol desaturase
MSKSLFMPEPMPEHEKLISSFIVLGSTNEMARKILNSPNHAEPCLVYSAAKVLLKENWVFLHGKAHADYRKALNVLFTKKALSYVPPRP